MPAYICKYLQFFPGSFREFSDSDDVHLVYTPKLSLRKHVILAIIMAILAQA